MQCSKYWRNTINKSLWIRWCNQTINKMWYKRSTKLFQGTCRILLHTRHLWADCSPRRCGRQRKTRLYSQGSYKIDTVMRLWFNINFLQQYFPLTNLDTNRATVGDPVMMHYSVLKYSVQWWPRHVMLSKCTPPTFPVEPKPYHGLRSLLIVMPNNDNIFKEELKNLFIFSTIFPAW